MYDTGDANPANKLLTESGKRSVLKRSRPTESPRKMSYLALDRRTAKPPFVGSNPTRASKIVAVDADRSFFGHNEITVQVHEAGISSLLVPFPANESGIAKFENQDGQRERKCHRVGEEDGPVIEEQAV